MSLPLSKKPFLLKARVAAEPGTPLCSQLPSCPAAGKATKPPAAPLAQPEGASFWDAATDINHQTQVAVMAHPSSHAVYLRDKG